LPIANLTHGQMTVMARWRGPILALADRVLWPDRDLRLLLRHEDLQHRLCAFGLMPGSVTDEDSPFNECTHAYLAIDREILLQMAARGERQAEAQALKEKVSFDMTANADALVGCQYSAERFNTASMVYPDLFGIPMHWPSALATLGLLLGLGTVIRMIRIAERRIGTVGTATVGDRAAA
jgi:hypothetical protein